MGRLSQGVVREPYAKELIGQEYPEYEAMAEAVREAAEMVAMAYELKAHRESDDQE